jgi:hypothetical protein
MDSDAALEELTTITRSGGPDQAHADQPDPGTTITGAEGVVEIGRYTARLAAFERTVLPAAERRLDDGRARTEAVREGGQQLTTVLHYLDRYLTGDARAEEWSGGDLTEDVQAAVATYTDLEQDLISELVKVMDEADVTDLIRSYHEAQQVAPTRPHPKLNYEGAMGRLKFRVAGLIDDVRDGTESRPVGPVVGADAAEALRDLDADAAADDRRPAVEPGAGESATGESARSASSDS